jgi:hypothetical protein
MEAPKDSLCFRQLRKTVGGIELNGFAVPLPDREKMEPEIWELGVTSPMYDRLSRAVIGRYPSVEESAAKPEYNNTLQLSDVPLLDRTDGFLEIIRRNGQVGLRNLRLYNPKIVAELMLSTYVDTKISRVGLPDINGAIYRQIAALSPSEKEMIVSGNGVQ